jgi:hypothetical protein
MGDTFREPKRTPLLEQLKATSSEASPVTGSKVYSVTSFGHPKATEKTGRKRRQQSGLRETPFETCGGMLALVGFSRTGVLCRVKVLC